MSKCIISLLIIFINVIYSKKVFKIPFKFNSISSYFPNQSHPVTNRFMSQLFIELLIGSPPQKLNCSLILNSFYSLFLSHELPDIKLSSYYNKTLSYTYNLETIEQYYWDEDFDKAEIFTDNIKLFSFDDKNIILNETFTFLLIDGLGFRRPNEFYASGLIGLRLRKMDDNMQVNENRFLYQIKKYGLADTETFFFDFNENDENGYFVIGEDLFNDNNYLKIYAGSLFMPKLGLEWSFNFDNIYYGNHKIEYSKDALIKTENELTVGPGEYEEIVDEFFKNENKCNLNYTKMGYATFKYYSCETDFDENKMEDLIFELNSINYKFILKGTDLFYIEKGKKYFKIIFLIQKQPYWHLGRHFLHKYHLRFDTDRKMIYIPLNNEDKKDNSDNNDNTDNNNEKNNTNDNSNDNPNDNSNSNSNDDTNKKDNESNKNNTNNNNIDKENDNQNSLFKQTYFWIIIILVIFIIGLILFIIIYLAKYPRKKRANELDDDEDYDYIQKDKNENIN